MKQTLALLFSGFMLFAQAQESTISIDSCIQWAKRNYPLIQQNDAYLRQESLNRQAINENWLPKINFQAQATYNTEVVQFNFPGMDIKFPHDAYMASLNLEQAIYDGGQTKSQKTVEHLNMEINTQQNEVELYKLVERINQLYVNILLGKENLAILELYKEDLVNRTNNMKIAVQNGMALEASLSELEAEILKADQNIIDTKQNLNSLYQNLSFYTNHQISETTVLELRSIGGNAPAIEIERPELKIFDLQMKMMEARYAQTNVQALPHISIGAMGNYGRPGPNFINQELRFFASANFTVRWNVSSLYGLKRERNKLDLNKNFIEIQKEVFLFNIQTAMNTQMAQLNAIGEQLATDDLIIEKRQLVTKTAVSQMENGKITVTNYLSQLNAELQAKLNKKVHEIRRMNTISMINATSGSFHF